MTREVDGLIKEGYTHVVDADLQAYFDSIPHEALMARVVVRMHARRDAKVSDGVVLKARLRHDVLDLIRGWLKADILKGLERWTPVQGSPRHADACGARRAVISPLLANIYLDPLDKLMAEHGYRVAAKRACGMTRRSAPAA